VTQGLFFSKNNIDILETRILDINQNIEEKEKCYQMYKKHK
jgi:hypothetical protein